MDIGHQYLPFKISSVLIAINEHSTDKNEQFDGILRKTLEILPVSILVF